MAFAYCYRDPECEIVYCYFLHIPSVLDCRGYFFSLIRQNAQWFIFVFFVCTERKISAIDANFYGKIPTFSFRIVINLCVARTVLKWGGGEKNVLFVIFHVFTAYIIWAYFSNFYYYKILRGLVIKQNTAWNSFVKN